MPISELVFGALTQNRRSLEDRTTTHRCHRASGRRQVSTLLNNLACILRHPDIRDAKIGGLHLPPLIDQPAFGPVRIANELRKRGLTVSPAGSQTKCLAILVAPVGPREPARLVRLTAFLMSKPGAYPKLDGNGAWWCVLKTTPVLG